MTLGGSLGRSRGPLSALLVLVIAGVPAAQEGVDPFDREGPLQNDTFLPTDETAAESLRRGDRLIARRPGDEQALGEALEAWRGALAASAPGATVPCVVDPDAGDAPPECARRTEAVTYAVLRRLTRLGRDGRGVWRARFGPVAGEELVAAGTDRDGLAAVERRNPGTAGAVRAALACFELALEQGGRREAGAWLDRAHLHLGAIDDVEPGLSRALDRRTDMLQRLAPTPAPRAGAEAWTDALRLRPVEVIPLAVRMRRSPLTQPGPGRGLVPDLAFLDDGTLVVRNGSLTRTIAPDGSQRPFVPDEIAADLGWTVAPEFVPGEGSWPLTVTTDGTRLFFVTGRARGPHGNVLLCLDPPMEASEPHLRWALGDRGLATGGEPDEEPTIGPSGLGPGRWELQPGALLLDDLLLVQARQWSVELVEGQPRDVDESQTRAYLLALEAETGRVRWQRFLAMGADVRPESLTRFGADPGWAVGAQPLAAAAGRVLTGTHMGIAALVEAADGRVAWTFRSRRRPGDSPGWSGSQPPVLAREPAPGGSGPSSPEPGTWLWAPADGEFLYGLRATPLLDGGRLQRFVPRPIGEALDLAGAGPDEALVLSRAGARRTLAAWDPRTGARYDSLHLARGEGFRGAALVSDKRVFFATDRGLFLLDRERELYLADQHPLPAPERAPRAPIGGSVHARGGRVVVLGRDALWTFDVVD